MEGEELDDIYGDDDLDMGMGRVPGMLNKHSSQQYKSHGKVSESVAQRFDEPPLTN